MLSHDGTHMKNERNISKITPPNEISIPNNFCPHIG